MKKLFTFICILFIIPEILSAQSLVNVIPAPNYSYGLTHDGIALWVGSSNDLKIWKIDDETGARLDSIASVTDETRGIGWDGSNLWGYQYIFGSSAANKDLIVEYGTAGIPLDTLFSPYEDYIGGMCYADGFLWISVYYTGSGNPAYLIKIDPATGAFVDTLLAPGLQPQGLAYDGQYLWCAMDDNDGDPENIWKIDPATGNTLLSFPIPPYSSTVTAYPRDLAWDGQYLYLVVGQFNDKAIYKFDLAGGGDPHISVSTDVLNFPQTTVGDTSNLILIISNIGTAPLSIDSIKFTESVFSTDVSSLPMQIPASDSDTFAVKFVPTAFTAYMGTMSIYNNDLLDPVVDVTLNGQGVLGGPVIQLTDDSHNFGNVWIPNEGIASWEFGIINIGDANLEISNLQLILSEYTYLALPLPFQVVPNDTEMVKIYFNPSAQGLFEDDLVISSNDPANPTVNVNLQGTGFLGNYDYGYVFWDMQVPDNPNISFQDYRVEGLKSINDITGDGIDEVIVATDNYWLLCLNGAGSGTTDIIWSFNSYFTNFNAGSIGQSNDFGVQDALAIVSDLNNDNMNDVVIGTGGGNEHVYAIDGTNGTIIWEFGNNVTFGLGDFEAVDAKRDFNNDNVPDVLAIADGNDAGTGYKKAYLFNGINGDIIWDYPYPGPSLSFGKSIISIDDVTSDGKPDAVIAVGNNGTTDLKAYLLNGDTGLPVWEYEVTEWEPKELLEFPVPGETPDVIVAEYFNNIYRVDGETGDEVWPVTLGSFVGIIQMNLISDVNNDGVNDILVASFSSAGLTCLDGANGLILWNYPMAFQYGVASVPDLNNDGLDEVVTGDQNGTFYCISGDGNTLLFSQTYGGDRINTVNVLPSIDGNYSYELLAGTREGRVVCFSGGLEAITVELTGFSAVISNKTVLLSWQTATELNNSHFEIERASSMTSPGYNLWRKIARVEGKGTTSEPQIYSFTDNTVSSGKYNYRLKQVDFDGSFEYSNTIEVVIAPSEFALEQNFPNPFNPSTTIRFTIPELRFTTLKVYDVLGNEVATLVNEEKSPGEYEVEFGSHSGSVRSAEGGLASGIYFYRLRAGNFVDTKKFILLK